tara:strand:- start:686 stop:1090 length:405 start_codon:yes stop_codon:yes gene_type:complete
VSAQEESSEADEIRMVLERLAGLMQAGDLEAIGEIYSTGRSVHIIEGVGVNHGWEEYRDDHLRPELAAFRNLVYHYFAIEPQVRGNIAYAAFRYELSADTEGGHIDIEGRGTIILEKMNDQWKIVHSHTSGRPK